MADSMWRWTGRIGAFVAIPCLIAAPFAPSLEWLFVLLIVGVIGMAANMVATMVRLGRLEHRLAQLVP